MKKKKAVQTIQKGHNSDPGWLQGFDFLIAGCAVLLAIFGIICIFSATYRSSYGYSKIIVQGIAVFLGIILMIILSMLHYEAALVKFSLLFFIGAVGLLLLTVLIGTGEGNKNWIRIPGTSIGMQSSEFVKLFFVLTLSRHIDIVKEDINKLKNVLGLCIHAAIIISLVMLQKDLGSALVYIFVFVSMLFAAGLSLWYLLAGLVMVAAAAPVVWPLLSKYQQMRILVGFNPELDPQGYGYQVIQSKKAIIDGGFFGKGFLNGTIFRTIPANHTDMIYPVMCEQFGMIGALVFFALIIVLVLRILYTARISRKDCGSYICVGVAAILIGQTLENVGMCLGMLPVIGITLPFMSYGGSSVLSLFMSVGVILSIKAHRTKYFFEREQA